MGIAPTQRTVERFEERNGVLRALTGLASVLGRVDRLFERLAPPAAERAASHSARSIDADDLAFALVGVAALRLTVRAELRTLASQRAVPEPGPSAPKSSHGTGGLLR